MGRSAPRWRSRSTPISMRTARSSNGGIRSGATATQRGLAAAPSRRCLPDTSWKILFRSISGNPPQANGGGGDRNSVPLYDFPAWKIESHRLLTMPVRTSALRTLGGQGNVFAIECFLDEVAAGLGEDPVSFRLRYLKDERARDVVRAAAKRAGWKPAPKPGSGYGVGYSRYKNSGAYC